VVVQDAATSVVWGMPGSVARAGLADAVLPLPKIADALLARVQLLFVRALGART
jgi:two-component system chemotaxis response regulator CheB